MYLCENCVCTHVGSLVGVGNLVVSYRVRLSSAKPCVQTVCLCTVGGGRGKVAGGLVFE